MDSPELAAALADSDLRKRAPGKNDDNVLLGAHNRQGVVRGHRQTVLDY